MNFKNQIVSIVGFTLLAITIFVYQRIHETLPINEVVIIILIGLLIFIAFGVIKNYIYDQPLVYIENNNKLHQDLHKKYEDLNIKLEENIRKIIRTQQFIDQNTLKALEERAEKVWVITTELDNEITDRTLAETVKGNLSRSNVTYSYFLPSKRSYFWKEHVNNNLKKFKELDLYKEFSDKISFTNLPESTQFLMKEVVIYNPDKDHIENDLNGINGFTFYEGNELDENGNKKILHMRIEGKFLKFLSRQLANYLEEEGLKIAAQNILTEYEDKLDNEQTVYIASLFKLKLITDSEGYESFINSIDDDEMRTLINRELIPFVDKNKS